MKLHPDDAKRLAGKRYKIELEEARLIFINETSEARKNYSRRIDEARKDYDKVLNK